MEKKIRGKYSSSAYNTSASLAASYGSAVLDPLLQASSLASAASAQTTSGEIKYRESLRSLFLCYLQPAFGRKWVGLTSVLRKL